MSDGFLVFDTDTHVGPPMEVLEPHLSRADLTLLERFSQYRKVDKVRGGVSYAMGERKYNRPLGAAAAVAGLHEKDSLAGAMIDGETRRSVDFDPSARIRDMDVEGVDVNLMIPSWLGVWTTIDDPSLELSMYRAYHRWMAEYCNAYPKRLFGVIILSGRNVEGNLTELRRCATERWPLAVFVYAPSDMPLDHPDLERYWAFAEENDLSVILHTFTSSPPYAPGSGDNWENHFLARSAAHPWCGMRNMASLIGAGVLDRYPTLRLGVLEAGHGWLPFWAQRLDEQAKANASAVSMKQLPSEYISSGRYFQSIDIAEGLTLTKSVIDQIGDQVLMYASDYPHRGSLFPESVKTVSAWDLPDDTKGKLFWQNPVRFYARSGLV